MKRDRTRAGDTEHHGRRRLWFAIFVGPLTWSADFLLSYVLTWHACSVHSAAFLLAFSALALGVTAAGLLVAVRSLREQQRKGNGGHTRADPTGFLARSGVATSGGFLLAILAAALPRLIIDPCV